MIATGGYREMNCIVDWWLKTVQFKPQIQSNEINHKSNIALKLPHRRRRWGNIKAILDERHMTDVMTKNGGYREMNCIVDC